MKTVKSKLTCPAGAKPLSPQALRQLKGGNGTTDPPPPPPPPPPVVGQEDVVIM